MKKVSLVLIVLLLTSFLACSKNKHSKITELEIRKIFKNWQKKKIESGEYLEASKCNLDFFTDEKNDLILGSLSDIGFPEDSEIEFYFGDFNDDNELDGIATFNIKPCNGAWALNNSQEKIVLLSTKNNKYTTHENYFKTINDSIGKGKIYIDSISENLVLATYYEHLDNDPNCCPSYKKQISIDLNSKIVF